MTNYDFSVGAGADPAQVASIVREFGIAHIVDYLDPSAARQMAEECHMLLQLQVPWVIPLLYSIGQSVRVETKGLEASGKAPVLSKAFSSDFMRSVSDAFMRGAEYEFNYDLYVALDLFGSDHYAHHLHYDRVPHLKFFFYLSEVHDRNGPFSCVPRSVDHAARAQEANRREGFIPSEEHVRMIPGHYRPRMVPVYGPAGTLLIIDSDVVHNAMHIVEGDRLVVRSRCIETKYLDAMFRGAVRPPAAP